MPKADLGGVREVESLSLDTDDPPFAEDAEERAVALLEVPDEPARDDGEQRVVEISDPPPRERPVTVAREEEALDAIALGGEHGADVFDAALDLLELVRMRALHLLRHRFLHTTARTRPPQLDLVHTDDLDRRRVVPYGGASGAGIRESIRRHRHLLEIVGRDRGASRRLRERLLDQAQRHRVLHALLEAPELRDGLDPGHRPQRPDAGVAHLRRVGPVGGHLLQAPLREVADRDGKTCIFGQERADPDETAQSVRVALGEQRAAAGEVAHLLADTLENGGTSGRREQLGEPSGPGGIRLGGRALRHLGQRPPGRSRPIVEVPEQRFGHLP